MSPAVTEIFLVVRRRSIWLNWVWLRRIWFSNASSYNVVQSWSHKLLLHFFFYLNHFMVVLHECFRTHYFWKVCYFQDFPNNHKTLSQTRLLGRCVALLSELQSWYEPKLKCYINNLKIWEKGCVVVRMFGSKAEKFTIQTSGKLIILQVILTCNYIVDWGIKFIILCHICKSFPSLLRCGAFKIINLKCE